MATAVQQRRGTTSEHSSFGGLEGEITVDTELKTVIVHDGSGNNGSGTRLAKYSELGATITAADESGDTTCFPVFTKDALGALAPKTDASAYTYNAGTGTLSVTALNVNGTVTADALDIDGTVDIDTGNTIFDVNTGSNNALFTSSNQGRQFQIVCTNTDDTACPDLVLRKANDTSGDDEFNSGNIRFENAHNDGFNTHAYSTITSYVVDQGASETDRTEADAQIRFAVMDGNDSSTALKNPTEKLKIYKDGILVTGTVTADGLTVDGTPTFNVGTNALSINSTGVDTALNIKTNSTTNANGPDLQFQRAVIPNVGDKNYHRIGEVTYKSKNTNDDDFDYVKLRAKASDHRDGQEKGTFDIFCAAGTGDAFGVAGAYSEHNFTKDGLTVDGTVTANAYTGSQTLSNNVTDTDITDTEFTGYVGTKIIYTGSGTGDITLPDAVAGDAGKSWIVINMGAGALTVKRDTNGQVIKLLNGSALPTGTSNLTLAIGAVAEIICTGADNYITFGVGIS
jgi:hypothetical protein